MPKRAKQEELKTRIASETARILTEDDLQNYDTARRKAARRIGCSNKRHFPDNKEIQQALSDYQQLFRGDTQPTALEQLRRVAVEAMQSLSQFEPRLVGSVLEGTADTGSTVSLQLFSESPEELPLHLMQTGIPWEESERLVRYSGGEGAFRGVYRIQAGEIPVELIALPLRDLRTPPLNHVTGRPSTGASIKQLTKMLQANPRTLG